MNLDFGAEPLFSWYVVLLFVSAVAMIVIGAVSNAGLSKGWRAFNVVAGVGFFGYAFYLAFLFEGGHYIIFFKAFILPVVLIINFFRSLAERRKAQPGQAQAVQAEQPQAAPAAEPGQAG